MSRNYLEASARSISFSKAIRYELTHETEEAVPATATSHDDMSDTISEAIIWELGQTFNTGAMRELESDDRCERFALTLSDDEMNDDEEAIIFLQAAMSPLAEQEPPAKSHTPKKAQRSLHHTKRPYTWRQPLKNKGGLIRKRLLEAKLANSKAKANMENAINQPENTNASAEGSSESPEDDSNIDELFEETEEEETIMMDGDTSSDDEAGMVEDENDLFVSKPKHIRTTPPSTTRQLVGLVRKKIGELYKLGDAESMSGFVLRERISGAVDKVKLDKVGDLSAADIVTLREALALLEKNQLAMDF
ncbi:hypothetical protein N431DRAFT_451141 [Stipitochalara longipes BDJ]|nr:hypothetical protein N431DRAFT_451141 [Stipitochalara longipes BDJ]